MIRIEKLSVDKIHTLSRTLSEYHVYEKIDGSELLFGIDKVGFYTSRELKGGRRYYDVSEYPITFSTTYMRFAHSVLQQSLQHLIAAGLTVDTQVEVEVLYDNTQNVIEYVLPRPTIVFLRVVNGSANIDDLSLAVQRDEISYVVPRTHDGRHILYEYRRDACDSVSLTPTPIAGAVSNDVSTYIDSLILNRHPAPKFKAMAKEYYLQRFSDFTPSLNSEFVEGLVFRHSVTGEQVKLVYDDRYTTARDNIWSERVSLRNNIRTPMIIDIFRTLENDINSISNVLNILPTNKRFSLDHYKVALRAVVDSYVSLLGNVVVSDQRSLEYKAALHMLIDSVSQRIDTSVCVNSLETTLIDLVRG